MWELIKGTVWNVTIQYTSLKKKNEKREEEIDDLDKIKMNQKSKLL